MFREEYRGKRVLVTGHTGFKGAWLSEWLLDLGAEVAGFSLSVPTEPSAFELIGLKQRMRDVRGDVRDRTALAELFRLFQPEVVFHLAAQPLVRASYSDPIFTVETNALGTMNVLECIRNTRSVHACVVVTTDKVYRNHGEGFAFRESDPLGGDDPYSASKACAEILFHTWAKSFLQAPGRRLGVASVRAGNVIGGGDWAEDRIVADCARAWTAGKSVTLRNPEHTRPWQHVLEPVGAYLLLGQKLLGHPERFHGEAFNIGPGGEGSHSVLELVRALSLEWPGADFVTHSTHGGFADSKKEAETLGLAIEKATKALGWHPRMQFREACKWTADWYRAVSVAPERAASLTREQIHAYSERFGK